MRQRRVAEDYGPRATLLLSLRFMLGRRYVLSSVLVGAVAMESCVVVERTPPSGSAGTAVARSYLACAAAEAELNGVLEFLVSFLGESWLPACYRRFVVGVTGGQRKWLSANNKKRHMQQSI